MHMPEISPLLGVKDMKRTLDFYEDKLGFKLGMVVPNRESPEYADASRFDSVLMFQNVADMKGSLLENFRFDKEAPVGVGVIHYINVPDDFDIDAYYEELKGKDVLICQEIADQLWGARTFVICDPDGHMFAFAKKIAGAKCLSCGMPLIEPEDHAKDNPEVPYCKHCTDAEGNLKPLEQVLEGFKNYFISQGMPPEEAEAKAKEQLRKSQVWEGKL